MSSAELRLPAVLLTAARVPLIAVGLPLGLGFFSGRPTAKVVQSDWYKNLRTPPGRPPRQVFPIVWPLLYISMGYASHLTVRALDNAASPSARSDLKLALGLYYTQLGLNFLWTPLFFGAKKTGIALLNIGSLTATTFFMTNLLAAHAPGASYMLLPYCLWLSFAAYLNAGIWWLNRREKGE
ncbi:TspO/MBR-like protein [Favolaschia claudopus]|uniref:TspO/MBR-like protein n=1 Tax=Favolaschia claudopus TaxID=2862362 RepID=A0AAW0EE75_9AGAR